MMKLEHTHIAVVSTQDTAATCLCYEQRLHFLAVSNNALRSASFAAIAPASL